MNVVAINGSARKNGNTSNLIQAIFTKLKMKNISCEEIQLAGKAISGCKACDRCYENKNEKCVIQNDILNEVIQKMKDSDCILLASPTYFCNVSTEMKALIDRAGRVGKANDFLFENKIGASIVPMARAGGIHTFNSMNLFFLIEKMIIPGSSYWNIGIGREIGEVNGDTFGMQVMETLADQIIWLLHKIRE